MLLEPDTVTYERTSHSLDTPAIDHESTSLVHPKKYAYPTRETTI
ncbi:hypothetical protein CEXT_355611, partial [Caerostris extrusa]